MMEQFLKIKDQYQKEIVFFRLGDFYEMFFDDALIASKILEIALTARDCGNDKKAPMCGIPYHAAETYISKLINRGYRVAICEQVEDPSLTKGIVKREVVKVITPGTVSAYFGPKDNNNHFIASITFHGTEGGIALIDFSTGECYISTSLKIDEIYREISKYKPAEIIIPQGLTTDNYDMPTYPFDASTFSIEALNKLLNNDFLHLKSYFDTLEISPLAKQALGGLLSYLLETQRVPLTHIQTIEINLPESYLVMDANVIKNLELVETLREGKYEGSLLSVIDKTVTSIGGRTIKR
jgi:DNA mismatch repair protein MutS